MRLKRIELAGFKSFVDPVRINLDRGITAIVGPNGSGKSNIVDAVRWVLGEHSARHLRGAVMDDLIFQGSETRPPVAMCDVELTFSVTPGILSSPYHELDEITIRRRLSREGGSDAYINGRPVRIKDVVDLFLDTGLSSRAYAIIEQGTIARMISAKPEERRLILEEAAGIMRYRSRRHEAELKMRSTRQNLERVTDLLEEVRSQCRSLKQQAARARRFMALQEEQERAQALFMAVTYRCRLRSCEEERQVLSRLEEEERAAERRHTQAEKELDTLRRQWLQFEEEAQGIQDALREAERKRSGLQREAERLAGERRLLAERRQVLEHRMAETKSRCGHLQKELVGVERRMADQADHEIERALEALCREEKEAVRNHEEQRHRRDRLLAEVERLHGQFEDHARRMEQATATQARFAERKEVLEQRQLEVHRQLDQVREALTAAEEAASACLRDLAERESHLERCQVRTERDQKRRDTEARRYKQLSGEVHRLEGEVKELIGRLELRDIPRELRESLRQAGAVWVDERLSPPPELLRAAAAALRGRSANVRLPVNPGLSPQLAGELRRANALPVAFHIGKNGAVLERSLAARLELPPDNPLYPLFASVLVVEDIMDAPAHLAHEPRASAAVSLDGWRLEADGWLVPPAAGENARRLQHRRALQERQRKLKRAEEELRSQRQRLDEAESRLDEDHRRRQQLQLDLTTAQSQVEAKQAKVGRLKAEVESLVSRLRRLQAEMEDLDREHVRATELLQDGTSPDEERLQTARAALAEQEKNEGTALRHLDGLRSRRAELERTLALHRQAAMNLQGEKKRLLKEIRRLEQQRAQDQAALSQLKDKIRRLEANEKMDQALSASEERVEELHRELGRIRRLGHDLQQKVFEAERKERRSRRELESACARRQQMQVTQAASLERLKGLEEEIEQCCRQGVNALLRELEEQAGEIDEEEILTRAEELKARLDRYGPVNLLAIDEYAQASEREQFLAAQAEDLQASLDTLAATIARIDRTTRQRFKDTFEQVNLHFKETFPRLFGGGRAELKLQSDDLLTAGVEVSAQPPGKRLQDIELLSGGEKALTAVALVFSIFRLKPAPFCILDEVDAPLDEANIGRFGELVREFADRVQFLNITHNKISMQMADRIIGVAMPEPGVSRIVGVDLESLERKHAHAA